LEFGISLALCLGLGLFAYKLNVLNRKGSLLAIIVGLLIAIFADLLWLITLIIFLGVTFAVTKLKYAYKRSKGLGEGQRGERGSKNVIANGLPPVFIAILRDPLDSGYDGMASILYISAIAVAASDTFASEVGVLSNNPVLITSPKKKVAPGTDGAVSSLGLGAAVVGAAIPAVLGWLLISDLLMGLSGSIETFFPKDTHLMEASLFTIAIPLVAGFTGCIIDSLLGATAQKRGMITNDDVNYFSIYFGIVLAYLLSIWLIFY